jgi:hypothetical protein
MFGKCDIAGYCDFGASKLSVDAFVKRRHAMDCGMMM